MTDTNLGCLSDRHLLLFGKIIQWFARYELLMQEIMAIVAGSDSGSVMLLTRGLDFTGKRLALFELLRHRTVPVDQYDRINHYLMIPHTLTPLRDDIAHSTWIAGPSSNWVQPDWILRLPPSIKPLHGTGFIEREDDKTAYSLADLEEATETLASNYQDFREYLQEIGLASRKGS